MPLITIIPAATGTTTLSIADYSRKGWMLYNDSTATCYVAFETGAKPTFYTFPLDPSGLYEMPSNYYPGLVTAAWSAANGNGIVTTW